jgi:RNA polymerase sigma-70 factor (ECF subfamily)
MSVTEALLDRPMPIQETDFDLIQRIAAGDEDALRVLYAAYGQRLYAFAVRRTGDGALADEIVQDSLVAVWQGARRFRGEGRVIAWLLGIVHHKALNALRGAQRERKTLSFAGAGGMDEPEDPAPSPAERADLQARHLLLRTAMDQLSSEHSTVLDLVFYQGLTLAETARVCGCPMGTVKSRLAYAKTCLRGVLSRAGYSAEELV